MEQYNTESCIPPSNWPCDQIRNLLHFWDTELFVKQVELDFKVLCIAIETEK